MTVRTAGWVVINHPRPAVPRPYGGARMTEHHCTLDALADRVGAYLVCRSRGCLVAVGILAPIPAERRRVPGWGVPILNMHAADWTEIVLADERGAALGAWS